MSIDPLSDELLTLPEAAAILPRRRKDTKGKNTKVSASTLWRWHTRGSRGVRLEIVKVGGQTYTSREALRAFIEARSLAGTAPVPQAPSPSTRSRRAMEKLKAMGM
jgi:hypothetical protein